MDGMFGLGDLSNDVVIDGAVAEVLPVLRRETAGESSPDCGVNQLKAGA